MIKVKLIFALMILHYDHWIFKAKKFNNSKKAHVFLITLKGKKTSTTYVTFTVIIINNFLNINILICI